jgi:hypothetical protein
METQEKESSGGTWALLAVFALFGVGLYIVNNWSSFQGATAQNTISPTQQAALSQYVQELKAQQQLPQTINNMATLEDIAASGTSIQYDAVLSANSPWPILTDATIKQNMTSYVCSNPSPYIKDMLDSGISLNWYFTVQGSSQTFFISFTKADCPSL